MLSYRKVGGLHWISLGRLRIAWCIKRQSKPKPYLGHEWATPELLSRVAEMSARVAEHDRIRGISKNAKGELRSFTIF